jgi:DNA-directed RNA polymerase subunit RPC12/RpoP
MTIQRRTLIEPRDIIGLEYECTHCGSRYLVPLKNFDRRVSHCPNCQEKWLSSTGSEGMQSPDQTISLFVDYLKQIQTRNLGVIVRLEIAEEDGEWG